jgi:hypothetical protein
MDIFSYSDMRFNVGTANVSGSIGNERMVIKNDGKVGIGETVPLGFLHIKNGDSGQGSINAAGNSLVLESNGSTGITFLSGSSSNTSIVMGDSESNYQGVIIYDHSVNAFKFATTGTERMRITSAGNVGIGTTSPAGALQVVGATATNNQTLHVKGTSSVTNNLISSFSLESATTGTAANGVGTSMSFWGSMSGQNNIQLGEIGFHNNNVSGAHGDFVVKTRPNGTLAERLRITSDGKGRSAFTIGAWVRFNQTSHSIFHSHNVSSIADQAVGQTNINFDTDYGAAPCFAIGTDSESITGHQYLATGSLQILIKSPSNSFMDVQDCTVMTVGNV